MPRLEAPRHSLNSCGRYGDAVAGERAQHGVGYLAMIGNQGAANVQHHQLQRHGRIIIILGGIGDGAACPDAAG